MTTNTIIAIAAGIIFVPGVLFVAVFAYATRLPTWEQSQRREQRKYERQERKRVRWQLRHGDADYWGDR